jgi:NAD(P)-dependent dehydrogenase (short-subunit alcohol dehydrogenase family)
MTTPPTILITGGTDGLGRALAHRLAADGAALILHGRDQDKLENAAAEIEAAHDLADPPATVHADFADLAQVRDLAARVNAVTDRLDVLVNNAGIGSGSPDSGRELSADGHELRFAVNYLAGFDLTLRLLPLLRAAAGGARIVMVASIGQAPIDFDDVMLERAYSGARAYGQSKLAQITAGFVLADRLPAQQITVNSLHPATYMPTKIVRESRADSVDSIEQGVAASRRLATEPMLDGVTGRFYNGVREAEPDAAARDARVQQRLWQLSLDLTGAPDPPT